MMPKLLLITSALLMAGCESLAYYRQSVAGHLDLLWRAEPITELLAAPGTDQDKRRLLREIQHMRRFASSQLGLPDNRSYTHYVDAGRPYLVWNVTANPEFDVRPKQWCYPVIGCAAYRGYYRQPAAWHKAATLSAQGYDTTVTGVPAYSTLGWTADPVPSTIAHWPLANVAALLFHELAHQQLYLPDDSPFNEAFAVVVADAGVKQWLSATDHEEAWHDYQARKQRAQAVVEIMLASRQALNRLYQSTTPETQKREGKQRILRQLKERYATLSADWPQPAPYSSWFRQGINNAHLSNVATYHELTGPLEKTLQSCGNNLPAFYRRLAQLRDLNATQRTQTLREGVFCASALSRKYRSFLRISAGQDTS